MIKGNKIIKDLSKDDLNGKRDSKKRKKEYDRKNSDDFDSKWN
jgi:hypothetical protein